MFTQKLYNKVIYLTNKKCYIRRKKEEKFQIPCTQPLRSLVLTRLVILFHFIS